MNIPQVLIDYSNTLPLVATVETRVPNDVFSTSITNVNTQWTRADYDAYCYMNTYIETSYNTLPVSTVQYITSQARNYSCAMLLFIQSVSLYGGLGTPPASLMPLYNALLFNLISSNGNYDNMSKHITTNNIIGVNTLPDIESVRRAQNN